MKWKSLGFALPVCFVLGCGQRPSTESVLPTDPERLTITLKSTAFADGGVIPKLYTCDGKNVSPPLAWSGVPKNAKALALICEDPDAPRGTWTHWVIADLPASVHELAEGVATAKQASVGADGESAVQGTNDFGKVGYGGPCPPSGTHHYIFRLFALDTRLDSDRAGTRQDLLQEVKGHVLAEGRLTGLYKH